MMDDGFNSISMSSKPPNKALQLTANPLRGLSAAELGRYVVRCGSLVAKCLLSARSKRRHASNLAVEPSGK